MPISLGFRRNLAGLGAVALMLSLVDCAPTQPIVAGPIPPGQARIRFYRVWEPSVSMNVANVELNGAPAGSVLPYGARLYQDVAPGHYRISVQSYHAVTEQTKDIDLAPGQEVFVKIVGEPDTSSEGDLNSFRRDNFYVRVVSPEMARAEIASGPS